MDLIAVGQVGLVTMLGVAVATDVGMRKIPNLVTVGGFGFALAVRGLTGLDPLIGGLLGAALGLALSFPLFAAGGLGGGDVKLLTATGAFLGPGRFFVAVLATAIIGALIAIFTAWRRRALTNTLLGTKDLAVGVAQRAVRSSNAKELPTLDDPGGIRNPKDRQSQFQSAASDVPTDRRREHLAPRRWHAGASVPERK